MKGWISDASCGVSNANAKTESRECARNCIKGGAKPVFVTESGDKVYQLAGKTNVLDHIDHKVEVKGDVKGDTLTIVEIKKAD